MSTRLANLNVAVAEGETISSGMSISIVDAPVDIAQYISTQLSPLIAEGRTLSSVLDVDIWTGVQAQLGVLVIGSQERSASLQIYIKSEALQIGASASYNAEGDEVESILYVEDGDTLHPEFIEEMRATLLYRNTHALGTVSFTKEMGCEDGTVTSLWLHPAHRSELSIQYIGTVRELGGVNFTIAVVDEGVPEIPLSENVLEGVDVVAPRTDPSSYQATTYELDLAPEEADVLHTEVVLTLLKLNMLTQYEYLEVGNGPVDYSGGGNRLLSLLSSGYVFQDKDALPPTINAHTRIESASSNLLTNANFLVPVSGTNNAPQSWSVTADSSITLIPGIEEDSSGVRILTVRAIGSGPYVGPKTVVIEHDDLVAASEGDPVTFSVLARVEHLLDETLVKDLQLVISFRDSGDVELSKETITFDPEAIKGSSLVMLQHTVSSPPVGTVAARVSLELYSVDGGDDIKLFLLVPQFEEGTVATSRIAGSVAPTNREADVLRVMQAGNIEFRKGSIITILSSDYDGLPTNDSCIFDTRDASGLNGFVATHLSDGRIRFSVAGPSSTKNLTTSEVFSFQAGIYQEVGVSWGSSFMAIRVNSEEAATSDTVVVLPQEFNEFIYLFQTSTGADRLEGELAVFEIRRDVQQ